jgi:hypothetical protein
MAGERLAGAVSDCDTAGERLAGAVSDCGGLARIFHHLSKKLAKSRGQTAMAKGVQQLARKDFANARMSAGDFRFSKL